MDQALMIAIAIAAVVYLIVTKNKKKEGYSPCGCTA